jgi:adenylate cyclase
LVSYGFVPKLHASLHTGSVVRAEIGIVKSKIAFHGDTMNTTARILGECNKLKKSLIVSDLLIRMIGLPNIYSKDLIGEVNLRGKEESLKLFEIKDKI